MSKSGALATTRSMEQRQKLKAQYTSKLEVESQRMEDRLKMLKTMLAAEKARRNADGGVYWKSTQSPKKPIVDQRAGEGRSPKPVRVRVLTNKEGKSKANSTPCGQCDKSSASLSCIECLENYCQVCFVKIHQKGALANHRVKPLVSKVNTKLAEKTAASTSITSPVEQKTSSCAVGTVEDNDSLLTGTYDEAASAASFQQALSEWRAAGRQKESKKKSTGANTHSMTKSASASTSTSTGTSTNSEHLPRKQEPVNISFSQDSGVSYLEKLITRRSRYDPTLLKKMASKPTTVTASSITDKSDHQEDEAVDCTPTPYNVFYEPDDDDFGDFSLEDCKELCRPMSSVQIEDITEPFAKDGVIESNTPSPQQQAINRPSVKTSQSMKSFENDRTVAGRKKNGMKTRPKSTKKVSLKPPSHANEHDMQNSLQKVWGDCSREKLPQNPKLSHFFLQGVGSQTDTNADSNIKLNPDLPASTQLNFAATVWLPFNSVAMDPHSPEPDSDSSEGEPPVTDLPSRCNSALSTQSQSHLEMEQIAEREEWDKEDCETLESLAWELMSTVESEGRLSRCDHSVLASTDTLSEDDNIGAAEAVDMSEVVSQFEFYQQQLLDEEI